MTTVAEAKGASRSKTTPIKWLNLVLTAVFIIWGFAYLAQRITLTDIIDALATANGRLLWLTLLAVFATTLLKAWRWQLMLSPHERTPPFATTFWAMIVGQFINTTIPVPRLGDVARVYTLNQQAQISKMRSLGTLIVEKTLDLTMLTLTLALVLPTIILPDNLTRNTLPLLTAALLVILCTLYLVTYQTDRLMILLNKIAQPLPPQLAQRFLKWTVSGLEGLAALRRPSLTILLLTLSTLISLLSILAPYILFIAFALPLNFLHAGLLYAAIAIIVAPATTPAQIGFFEFAVYVLLTQLLPQPQEALLISYAITFHVLAIAPQLLLGIPALIQTNWRRHSLTQAQHAMPIAQNHESAI